MRSPATSPKGTHSDIGVRTHNNAEADVCRELESEGYEVLKRGWPDFIAVRDGDVRLIEVKRRGQHLKPPQRRVREILALLGIEVEVQFRD